MKFPRRWSALALATQVSLAVLGLAATGCFEAVPYVPRPTAVEPERALDEAVHLAAHPPLYVEVTDRYLKVAYDLESHLDTHMLRFESVHDIQLAKASGVWVAQARGHRGKVLFTFYSNDRAAAEQFIDALAAVVVKARRY